MQDTPASQRLGAFPCVQNGQAGWMFRVAAPAAAGVSVVGDFNQWDPGHDPMQQVGEGVWQTFLPYLREYDTYKYALRTQEGDILYKSDPYAFHNDTPPDNCSKLYDGTGYRWSDDSWFAFRREKQLGRSPLNCYEVHLGSWRRTGMGEVLSYRTVTGYLVPYVKTMGYTAVIFMPLMEHQEDGSFGYLPDSWFAPTSRFGPPQDFMHLIDELHRAGVGVFMDWPCGSFPVNEHGLAGFDGSALYETEAELDQEGVRAFDFSKPLVRRVLMDSALFWLEHYHLDGLRVCGTSVMQTAEAHAFLQELVQRTRRDAPERVITLGKVIVTDSASTSGNLCLNRGWGDHLLSSFYQNSDAGRLASGIFSPLHACIPPLGTEFTETISHLITDGESQSTRLAAARLCHLLLLAYPGKKLTFMGTEFGQEKPWDYRYSLDWHLLHYDAYHRQQRFFREANLLYLSQPAFWERDNDPEGYQTLIRYDELQKASALRRVGMEGSLLVVLNFSKRKTFRCSLQVEGPGTYRVLLNTDDAAYGGQGQGSSGMLTAAEAERGYHLPLEVPPVGGLVVAFEGPPEPSPILLPVDETDSLRFFK
ncbi:MAG: alpha amylase C-terminal domain-containing protein [Clostridiales bacterium]|nr:alpha amylase C-terminal domain-containing protein [Clostridiales bacterium]